jgi:hypothetical protein
VEYWIDRLVMENNETMKIVVKDDEKMLIDELEERGSRYWIVVHHLLRILLFSLALALGGLSVMLVARTCRADRDKHFCVLVAPK